MPLLSIKNRICTSIFLPRIYPKNPADAESTACHETYGQIGSNSTGSSESTYNILLLSLPANCTMKSEVFSGLHRARHQRHGRLYYMLPSRHILHRHHSYVRQRTQTLTQDFHTPKSTQPHASRQRPKTHDSHID